jgi:hypothetical protein
MSVIKIVATLFIVLQLFTSKAQVYFNTLDSSSRMSTHIEYANFTIYSRGSNHNVSGSGTVIHSKYNLLGQISLVDTFSVDSIASYNGNFDLWHNKIVTFNATDTVLPYVGDYADCQISVLDTNFNPIWSSTFGVSNQQIAGAV